MQRPCIIPLIQNATEVHAKSLMNTSKTTTADDTCTKRSDTSTVREETRESAEIPFAPARFLN
eukprot:4029430-Pyramimonas_sp.AAC.1